jgi:hypothetical protein
MSAKECKCAKCEKSKPPKVPKPDTRAADSIAKTIEEREAWPSLEPKPTSRYVILRGINNFNVADRIFQPYPLPGTNELDPTKNNMGEVIYVVVGFADTIAEARNIFLGEVGKARGPSDE